MSLPFLARAAVAEPGSASRIVGYLYGINVVGAALGALATPWVLVRLLGVRGAIQSGAVLSALSGIAAFALTLAPPGGAREARVEAPAGAGPSAEPAGSRPLALWVALYTLSGFVALSLEILWFRVVDVAVKSTAFTFGTVLAGYLAGLATGSLLGATRRWSGCRSMHPESTGCSRSGGSTRPSDRRTGDSPPSCTP